MIVAGITGTIGTGKTTVASMFKELGAFIIDHDQLARLVIEPGKKAWQELIDQFGSGITDNGRNIDRTKLASIVFNDPEYLQKLNSIVHPEILNEDIRLTNERKAVDPEGLIIKDVPLLLEVGSEIAHLLVDKIIVVYASPEIQFKRLISRGMSEGDARRRIDSQIPVKSKLKDADFVINNDGTLEETRQQVQDVYSKLMAR
jgi:dephospho-CoA kinase